MSTTLFWGPAASDWCINLREVVMRWLIADSRRDCQCRYDPWKAAASGNGQRKAHGRQPPCPRTTTAVPAPGEMSHVCLREAPGGGEGLFGLREGVELDPVSSELGAAFLCFMISTNDRLTEQLLNGQRTDDIQRELIATDHMGLPRWKIKHKDKLLGFPAPDSQPQHIPRKLTR